jgi:hypothetical protein
VEKMATLMMQKLYGKFHTNHKRNDVEMLRNSVGTFKQFHGKIKHCLLWLHWQPQLALWLSLP